MKFDTKSKMLLIIIGIIFLIFNVVFFLAVDITHISVAAVISWIFMVLGFASFVVLMRFSFVKRSGKSGLVLGLPILKHCIIYLITDFILAVLFTVLGALLPVIGWVWPFAIQFVVFGVHIIIAVLCLMAKETIENVGEKVHQKTAHMKMLRADAAMLPELCTDEATKAELKKFAEAVRYSDPVSNEALEGIEARLEETVEEMKSQLNAGDFAGAQANCKFATNLLKERNIKCKTLK